MVRGIGIAVLATATSNDIVGKAISDYAYFHNYLVIGAERLNATATRRRALTA